MQVVQSSITDNSAPFVKLDLKYIRANVRYVNSLVGVDTLMPTILGQKQQQTTVVVLRRNGI